MSKQTNPFPSQEVLANLLGHLYESFESSTWDKEKRNLAKKYWGVVKEMNINEGERVFSIDIVKHSDNKKTYEDLYQKELIAKPFV